MTQKPAPRIDLMPSACERWMKCSASPRFCFENDHLIPADLSSRFSQEGVTAHEVAAALLQDREPNLEVCPTPIDAEMRMHAWEYSEYVHGLRTEGAGLSKLTVEHKQSLWFYEGRNAIVDAAVLNPDSLHIIDFKYGAGVVVKVEGNLQLSIYARQIAGPLNLPLDFPVFLHVYQPRSRNSIEEGNPAHVWETTWGEIKRITDEIADHAEVILINHRVQGNPLEFYASEETCRWCPAKAFCPARQADMMDGLESLEVLEAPAALPLPSALSIEQLAAVLKHGKKIKSWIDDAEAYAQAAMQDGAKVPGFKLVMSRGGNRYWRDPKKAAELLVKTTVLKREEVIEEKTISPAQAEKLVGKKKFPAELESLITRNPGAPEIAPESDKRESCAITAATEFVALDDVALDRLEDY